MDVGHDPRVVCARRWVTEPYRFCCDRANCPLPVGLPFALVWADGHETQEEGHSSRLWRSASRMRFAPPHARHTLSSWVRGVYCVDGGGDRLDGMNRRYPRRRFGSADLAGGTWAHLRRWGGGGAKTVKRPPQQQAQPQYANYWAPLTRKLRISPHSAQPQHTNHWAPRTRKRHQQEHRPQRPTERSDPTQHAKGRKGDCPGPRKETTTGRHVTQGGGGAGPSAAPRPDKTPATWT